MHNTTFPQDLCIVFVQYTTRCASLPVAVVAQLGKYQTENVKISGSTPGLGIIVVHGNECAKAIAECTCCWHMAQWLIG